MMSFNPCPAALLIAAAAGATLGVWKLIEVIFWVCSHVHWQ